jgi:hypothetical protein
MYVKKKRRKRNKLSKRTTLIVRITLIARTTLILQTYHEGLDFLPIFVYVDFADLVRVLFFQFHNVPDYSLAIHFLFVNQANILTFLFCGILFLNRIQSF